MNVIHLRPIGWSETTPRQWGTLRDLIRLVQETALYSGDWALLLRAQYFLMRTEGRDV